MNKQKNIDVLMDILIGIYITLYFNYFAIKNKVKRLYIL